MSGAAAAGASYLPYIVPVILAVLGSGALVAFFRARPEGSKIIVDAAQGAVVVQSGVLTDLRAQLSDAQGEIKDMRKHLGEVTELRAKVGMLETQNRLLRQRVKELEDHQ